MYPRVKSVAVGIFVGGAGGDSAWLKYPIHSREAAWPRCNRHGIRPTRVMYEPCLSSRRHGNADFSSHLGCPLAMTSVATFRTVSLLMSNFFFFLLRSIQKRLAYRTSNGFTYCRRADQSPVSNLCVRCVDETEPFS